MSSSPAKKPIPFGKYLLLDRINIGGMAEVWRGKTFGAGGFERLVAIKRILPNIAEDEEFISMFIDEAKITVQLTHANIAQIYELGHIQSSYFIAMEYIPGKDMRAIFDRCRKKGEPAPVPLTCYVVAKLCEGLDYAHRKKDGTGRDMTIVHRDVSPQNVLISYEGEVKVIDFGIAKAVGKATKTQAGILKGKFGYMSPEQIRGVPIDHRSDIFALGVCLYEMLTGERLFVGDSDFSVLEKVRKAEVLPPSTYNRRVPEALERIVLKALARDTEERYQWANEVADDLQRFLITSDSIFSRKDLAQYMKSTFAEEVEREKQRLQEYGDVKAPEGMAMGDGPIISAMAPQVSAPAPAPTPVPLTTVAPTAVTPALSAPSMADAPATIPPTLIPVPVPRRSNPGNLVGLAAAPAGGEEEADSTVLVHGREYFAAGAGGLDGAEPPTVTGSLRDLSDEATSNGRPGENGMAADATVSSQELSSTLVRVTEPRPRRNGTPLPPASVEELITSPHEPRAARPRPAPQEPLSSSSPEVTHSGDSLSSSGFSASFGGFRRSNKLWVYGAGAVAALLVANLILMIILLRPPSEGFVKVNLPKELAGKNVRLSIDGTYLQEGRDFDLRRGAPLKRVKSGKTLVVINADGYQELQLTVEVRPGAEPTTVDARLARSARMARLVVLTQPPAEELKVNGEVIPGDADGVFAADIPLGEDAHVEARKPGYEKAERRVTPRSNEEPMRINVLLKAMEYPLTVSSNPSGATITAGGKTVLGTTPATIRVQSTVSELLLTKRCYEPTSVPVRFPESNREPTPVTATLRKKAGCH